MIGSRNRVWVSKLLSERFSQNLSSVSYFIIRLNFNFIAHLLANNILLYSLPFQVTIEVFEDEKVVMANNTHHVYFQCIAITIAVFHSIINVSWSILLRGREENIWFINC